MSIFDRYNLHSLLFKLLSFEAGKAFKKYLEDISDPINVQNRNLMAKLKASAKSEFGKKYGFQSIKTVDEFRNAVPIHSYEDLKPYVEKVKNGDPSALFNPGQKIIMFALTSGTTDSCKYIPVTKRFLKEYKKSSFLWGLQAFIDHPDFLRYKILTIVSPYDESKTELGVPCGSISGLVAATQKLLARNLYIMPYWVFSIPDAEEKYYTLLRIACAEPDIGFITTANPSTLIKLACFTDKYKEQIIKDIHDGTFYFKSDIINRNKNSLGKKILKNPARAKQLEEIAGLNGNLYPEKIWGNLQFVATWKGGVLSHYIEMLAPYYGDIAVRDLGLIASEGRMSIPNTDNGSGGVLDISSHFFEFVPEEDYNPGKPMRTLLAHQLKPGNNYYIILTNSAGFFRYDINDLVRAEGYYENTPVISFLNKGKHISSLTGEKVSEYQIINAVKETAVSMNIKLQEFTVSPCWDKLPYYGIILENNDWINTIDTRKFIFGFDENLKKLNCEYMNKRDTLRLGTPVIIVVKNGSFDKIKNEKISISGGRSEQYKHIYLSPQTDYHKNFEILSEVKV